MAASQMEGNPTAAAQDLIPPTRPMADQATLYPSVRTWLGPGVNNIAELPPAWQRLAIGHTYRIEDVARDIDKETWEKWDEIQKDLKKANNELDRVVKFHSDAQAGGTDALDQHINRLSDQFARSPSTATRQKVVDEMAQVAEYHKELQQTRPGGTLPEAPASLDITPRAEQVAKVTAKRNALYQDVERSIARAEGLWGLRVEDAKAWIDKLAPDAPDRISEPWRGERSKNAKNPYKITLTKGPTIDQLLEARKADFPQQADPIATAEAKPGETAIETATRVNTTNYDKTGKLNSDTFYKQAQEFMKKLKPGGPAQALPEIGQFETVGRQQTLAYRRADDVLFQAKPGETEATLLDRLVKEGKIVEEEAETAKANDFERMPAMASGMSLPKLWAKEGAFEFDGKSMTMQEALNHISSDEEAFKSFGTCILEP
jgi:polyhydroxyalkanoate synthesis regulator phasin